MVNDYLTEKAQQLAASIPGCRAVADPLEAVADVQVDAVLLASPGPAHDKQLLACLEHRKPVLCEKPLTTDVASALEIVRREAELGAPLIQVGFMRRFDHEYAALKAHIDGGGLGQPLVMHCVHRNPAVPPSFDSSMVVRDSLVHEVDVTRFLFGEEIASIQIVRPVRIPLHRRVAGSADRDHEDRQRPPCRRRAVRDDRGGLRGAHRGGRGTRQRHDRPGRGAGPHIGARHVGGTIAPGFRERFGQAYDTEVQRWVDAVRSGVNVDGPTAWDGYAATAVCEAGVRALDSGDVVPVELARRDG